MKTFKLLIALTMLFCEASWAQQENIFSQYRDNMTIINPAYAGVDNQSVITGAIRKQWTGIKEAPETQSATFSAPFGRNLGLGISLVNDKTFIEKQTFLGIDVSYKLAINTISNIYFGLKFGGNFYNINASGLESYNLQYDPSLRDISNFNPNIGVGVLYKTDRYFVSLAVPRLLTTNRAKQEGIATTVSESRPHFYLSGGFDWAITESLTLKPTTMLRYVSGAPMSADLNLMLNVDGKFEIGGAYRTDNAYIGICNVTISKRLNVGFAYEMSGRSTLASAKNTNELFLKFNF